MYCKHKSYDKNTQAGILQRLSNNKKTMTKKLLGLFLGSLMMATAAQANTTVPQVTGVTVSDTTTTTATVTWDAIDDGVDFYKVRLMDENQKKIKAKKVTDETKTFKKLTANTNYTVQVRAVVDGNKGEWSDIVSFTTDAVTNHDISITDMSFSLSTVTINVGDSVTWTNNDTVSHTVTSDGDNFDSGSIAPGETFALDFSPAGTYSYHCDFHPSMTGTVVVE